MNKRLNSNPTQKLEYKGYNHKLVHTLLYQQIIISLSDMVCFIVHFKTFFFFQAKGAVAKKPYRLPEDHEMFTRLSYLLISGKAFCLYKLSL